MPRAFGTFQNNFTIRCVCDVCNQYFGDNLELIFARDSIEALRRLQFGLKPPSEIQDLPLKRFITTIAAKGPWKGAKLVYFLENNEWVVGLVPQVGLPYKNKTGRRYLTEKELRDRPIPADVDPRAADIVVVSPDEATEKRLVTLLASKGIPFHKKRSLPPPPGHDGQVFTQVNFNIDAIVRRCVAKIAFNYMAYIEGPDLALRHDFDVTRRFIRFAERTMYPLVVPSFKPILSDDQPTRRQTNGHLVTLGWSATGRDIVGQVSPFNEITYAISLARNFSGIFRDIRSGHCFDFQSRTISPLGARVIP